MKILSACISVTARVLVSAWSQQKLLMVFQMSVTKLFVPYLSGLYVPHITNVYLWKRCLYFGLKTSASKERLQGIMAPVTSFCGENKKNLKLGLTLFIPAIKRKWRSAVSMPFSCLVLMQEGEVRRSLPELRGSLFTWLVYLAFDWNICSVDCSSARWGHEFFSLERAENLLVSQCYLNKVPRTCLLVGKRWLCKDLHSTAFHKGYGAPPHLQQQLRAGQDRLCSHKVEKHLGVSCFSCEYCHFWLCLAHRQTGL